MDPLLKRLWQTYGGAVADTAGGLADTVTTAGLAGQFIANPVLAMHLRRQMAPAQGAMQRSVPQPRSWQGQAARLVTGMAIPIPGPKKVENAGKLVYHGGRKLAKDHDWITYFTNSPRGAETYANEHMARFGVPGQVNKARLKLKNPAPLEAQREAFRQAGWDYKGRTIDGSMYDGEIQGYELVEKVLNRLKEQGYDGLGPLEDGTIDGSDDLIQAFIALSPDQWDLLD